MDYNKPAKYLEGIQLKSGWMIKSNISFKTSNNTNRFFESYLVEDTNGNIAILKALDFSIALLDSDPTHTMSLLSNSYEFEKELLELCKGKNLNKIIKIYEHSILPAKEGSVIPVPYLILEYSKADIRSQIDFDSRLNNAWLLRILHNVTVGLWQLHKQGIAHTKIQPDTIIEFSKSLQKIAELGSSARKGMEPNSQTELMDPSYSTPEYLYGQLETDWVYKYQATDAYMLGNLMFFLFTQSSFNTYLKIFLHENHQWGKWGGTYSDVLPYVIDAYVEVVSFFATYIEVDTMRSELVDVISQLCHPDPKKRGHPRSIDSIGSSLSVERYISIFGKLAKKAELNLLT